ncbi:MAG: DUF3500 domain-containing protein [Flavobacteriaceae bacterium]
MRRSKVCCVFFCFSLFFSTRSQDLNTKAQEFLATLSPELKEKTCFTLTDEERLNWYFTPVYRKGSTLNDFNEEQKQAALELLRASISADAYLKTQAIMDLENILFVIENDPKMPDGSHKRDPLNYHFSIFGDPADNGFWGWRFEGHHVSLNFVASKGELVSSTPAFMGSNPGKVRSGERKDHEVLKLETALGYALVRSLSDEQLASARFLDTSPIEIFTSNQPKASPLEHKGISYANLSEQQKTAFKDLVQLYLDKFEANFSEEFKIKIEKAGLENHSFAWAGSLDDDEGHYYSVQGPFLLIEYDNTQNDNNHVHTVVRDLTNDFGEDLLQEHYSKDHSH